MFYWIVFEYENKNLSKGTLITAFNYWIQLKYTQYSLHEILSTNQNMFKEKAN